MIRAKPCHRIHLALEKVEVTFSSSPDRDRGFISERYAAVLCDFVLGNALPVRVTRFWIWLPALLCHGMMPRARGMAA